MTQLRAILLLIPMAIGFLLAIMKSKIENQKKEINSQNDEIQNTKQNAEINAKVNAVPFSTLSSELRKSAKRRS
jgi:predicted Holliday junction resolvase-like endonuclease